MLRQDSSSIRPDGTHASSGSRAAHPDAARVGSVDIQRELNRMEELILDSPRIPLSRRTMVDEEQILDQLDLIRLSLPEAFHEAEEIVRQKDAILDQAEQYAQELIEAAERRAAQIVNESGILRQAEMEAQQIRQQVQQECDGVQQQTIAEIERTRRQAQQDLEEMRRISIEESEEIQAGADRYADRVLRDMEAQMGEMLRIVRNGRQQLQINQPQAQAKSQVQVQVPRSKEGNPNVGRPTPKGGERKN